MKAYRPTSRAWQERVAPGVVKLAKRTMPWLSVRAALCAVCVQERGRRKRWVGRTDSCGWHCLFVCRAIGHLWQCLPVVRLVNVERRPVSDIACRQLLCRRSQEAGKPPTYNRLRCRRRHRPFTSGPGQGCRCMQQSLRGAASEAGRAEKRRAKLSSHTPSCAPA